ncbi:prohead [Escherichia phage ECD7]|uniref:Putative prohead core protein I n=1 Tax=Escherichia phage ECD7 TaxID=1981499 RepID=A0A220NTI8_9CAUD|nr:prohead [Escherichia phage ECD7]ASJ80248.1 putative prohead core protein I [Escherichia phage ECD7]
MKQFIEAIKTRDLTLIEKEFDKIMEAKKARSSNPSVSKSHPVS